MGKLYDILTNGDSTVPPSADNFFSWATPGIPLGADDLKFLSQGFTCIVTPSGFQTMLAAKGAAGSPDSGGVAGTPAAGAAGGAAPPALTAADLEKLRAQDTAGLFQQAEFFARLVDFVPEATQLNNEHYATLAVMN